MRGARWVIPPAFIRLVAASPLEEMQPITLPAPAGNAEAPQGVLWQDDEGPSLLRRWIEVGARGVGLLNGQCLFHADHRVGA